MNQLVTTDRATSLALISWLGYIVLGGWIGLFGMEFPTRSGTCLVVHKPQQEEPVG